MRPDEPQIWLPLRGKWLRWGVEFSLLVGILNLYLFGVTGPYSRRYPPIKKAVAQTQIAVFKTALQTYVADNRRPPTTAQGLRALIAQPALSPQPRHWQGPYLNSTPSVPKDPWGNDYVYTSPGRPGKPYLILSLGKDGKLGGTGLDADVTSAGGR